MHVVPVTCDINYLCWWRHLVLPRVLYLLLWVLYRSAPSLQTRWGSVWLI